MLLDMRVKTAAARMLCMATASAIDAGSADQALASLLTPLAKSYATDIAVEVTSTAIQVHGGMGYVEETGVAQYYRDARILPIYEGTNGIQAIDLVTRKLGLEEGRTLSEILQACKNRLANLAGGAATAQILADVEELSDAMCKAPMTPASLAAATPYLRALAATVAAGYLAEAAQLARGSDLQEEAATDANYFFASELPMAVAAAKIALAAAEILNAAKLG